MSVRRFWRCWACPAITDTLFVFSRLRAQGLTALNLALPVYSLINGAGLMLGVGGADHPRLPAGRDRDPAGRPLSAHTKGAPRPA